MNFDKLPKKIMIKGERWKVYFRQKVKDGGGTECAGLAIYPDRKIFIDVSMDQRFVLATFLHEYFHAVNLENGILDQSISGDHEHLIVEGVASDMSKYPEIWSNLFKLFAK